MIKSILWAVDDSKHGQAAGVHAMSLAQTHGAQVTALVVGPDQGGHQAVPLGAIELAAQARAAALAKHQAAVTKTLGLVRSTYDSIDLHIQHDDGKLLPAIQNHWRFHDLLVLNPNALFEHQTPHPEDGLHGLIAAGVRPILCSSHQYRPVRKVVVAFNGSMQSAKTLKRFAQMNLWKPDEVHLVYFGNLCAESTYFMDKAKAYCAQWGISAQTQCIAKTPEQGLPAYLDNQQPDLLVMGNGSHSWFARKVMGCLVRQMVEQTKVPVMLSA